VREQPLPIEDYALIGNTRTAALVARDGCIDWLCAPRFDSAACFAALLGTSQQGRWHVGSYEPPIRSTRAYRNDSLVLDTELETASGVLRITDCMPPEAMTPTVVRVAECTRGEVELNTQLIIRFDYGWVVPWVRNLNGDLRAVGGPDALTLRTPLELRGENLTTVGRTRLRKGQRVPFVLSWHRSNVEPPPPIDAMLAIEDTERWWHRWAERCSFRGPWRNAVIRSLVTLKALTYSPTGGTVAAATTSLPERLGGVRNWDFRYVWLRDATFTLYALVLSGFKDEAAAWRDWLLRAVAGAPSQLQIMYGVAGERRLTELELPWLPGYQGARPVRVGNAAVKQLQLDVYGEVMDAFHQAYRAGLPTDENVWRVGNKMLDFLETGWTKPDEGIWEVRGAPQHFTHSKVMAWVAFDRAVKAVERHGVPGPVDRWRALRDQIHAEVLVRGFDSKRQAFVQAYGSPHLDASLLMMPLVGFLPPTDPRMIGTVRAIERELMRDGLVLRYDSGKTQDGLPEGEGVFLLCSFWLADNFALMGRELEARALFERLLSLRNDVGLLSEQYDPVAGRMLGNFPQAFSHVGLVNTAFNLVPHVRGPAKERKAGP
jgi:GH15 family glucan-1,4-alpha-glucosidase